VPVARRAGAVLHLLRVLPPPHASYGKDVHVPPSGLEERIRDEARAYLEEVAHRIGEEEGLSTSTTVAEGSAAEVICRQATEDHASLVVMATHGRTGLTRLWLGSVADEVLRGASGNVLLLRPLLD
jgi:nucleotide-binding universal stress UspA family protein